jgi:hypothetical protein
MGERQKQLLKLLRGSKPGLTVEELCKGLEITRMQYDSILQLLKWRGWSQLARPVPLAEAARSNFTSSPSPEVKWLSVNIPGLHN